MSLTKWRDFRWASANDHAANRRPAQRISSSRRGSDAQKVQVLMALHACKIHWPAIRFLKHVTDDVLQRKTKEASLSTPSVWQFLPDLIVHRFAD